MVDVGGKRATRRTAHAVAVVVLPRALAARLRGGDIGTAKGPVFSAAILAGIMGAKRTAELIPLCHCRARTTAKTGVEMEALTGACVAALTLYDMGKAVTHGIVIRDIRLLEKTGGKKDYRAP
jgi:cyclic pyranopterin phosphate synthase